MFKKIIVSSLVTTSILIATPTLASNFYVGLGAGISNLDDNIATSSNQETHDLGANGALASVFVGYQINNGSPFQLGFEAFADGMNTQASVNHNEQGTDMKVSENTAYGVRILPGYEVKPEVVVHAILGYARGNFKLQDDGAYGTASSNFGSNGIQVGAGFVAAITKAIAVRGDIIYTGYNNVSVDGVSNSNEAMTYTNQLSTVDGLLALQYSFG